MLSVSLQGSVLVNLYWTIKIYADKLMYIFSLLLYIIYKFCGKSTQKEKEKEIVW